MYDCNCMTVKIEGMLMKSSELYSKSQKPYDKIIKVVYYLHLLLMLT